MPYSRRVIWTELLVPQAMIQAIERLQAVKLRDHEVLQLVLRANRRTLSGNPE